MNVLILDIESTISNKGNPFDNTNKCVVIGLKWLDYAPILVYNINGRKNDVQTIINTADLIVGFNIKFDLHWLRKVGIDISKLQIWDCQLAEFILNYQETPYPSLDSCASKYGFDPKIDVVKEQYWDKGIDTDKIPHEVLSEYLTQDLVLTEQVYNIQLNQFKNSKLMPLFRLQCQDLLVLEDMEFNGIVFSTEKALNEAERIKTELEEINKLLSIQVGGVPFNPASNDDVSCLLYGGDIKDDMRIPIGVYKTGTKIGQTRYKIVPKVYTLPRLVDPIEGTLVKKSRENPDGPQYYEVNETILRKLKLNKTAKKVVDLLDKYGKLEKLRGTYLTGWSKLIETMNWDKDTLHGQFNQCVAITGRLSSSKPNLQNADKATKKFMESRYV